MSFGGFGGYSGFGGYGGYGNPALSMALHEMIDDDDDPAPPTPQPKAMASTNTPVVPKVEIKELPSGALVLAVAMPAGVSPADVRVQVEDGNVLAIDAVAAKATGKFERIRYALPDSADLDSIRAVYKDGVLTVTVEKLPPPGTKKPRVVEVKICTVGDQRGSV